jgi:alpha,alpha-trehalose phosphorylase
VIQHPAFEVDTWAVRENQLDLDTLAQTESVFALANGHIGLRGNLDEGEPFGLPGTYLSGFYEVYAQPYPESGYGNPDTTQIVVNVTNGKIIRLLVEDEPFDVRYGELRSHQRVLDLRSGLLRRSAEWVSPTGRAVRIWSTRLVSFAQRAVAAIQFEVEPVDETTHVVLQSELVANEPVPLTDRDPRAAVPVGSPLLPVMAAHADGGAFLLHSTASSSLRIAAAMDHSIDGPAGIDMRTESTDDLARVMVTASLKPGERLQLTKFLGYGWSGQRSATALRDQVRAATAEARYTGWDDLVAQQRTYLDDFWSRSDIELEGDDELQQAVRFGLFHILQAGARAEQRSIAAKGLTGSGYDGHAFWDTETFVLPVLTYTRPAAARDALLWRHSTLDLAKQRAAELGLEGAAFPWRTIRGQECSGYWPAGTAAFHVNADIADAVERYRAATEDDDFERHAGVELLVETSRFWSSAGHYDSRGRFRIDGVTGPDEYSAVADNNVYTNLMAQRNFLAAAQAVERHPDASAALGVDGPEVSNWRRAAEAMLIPYDEALGIHPQAEQFTEHQVWDFAATTAERYPLLLHFPYLDLYRKQVVKQADLVLAMHLRGDAFSPEQKARNFDYYEALTVRDSSLSASTQAILAAEMGHLDLAYDYLAEAALMDLDDLEHNTRDGLHIASLAGTWNAIVAGFGGMRDHDGSLTFSPRLPEAISRLAFRLTFRGRLLLVEIKPDRAIYSLLEGPPLEISHHGDRATVESGRPVTLPIVALVERETPTQPHDRAPARRSAGRMVGGLDGQD